MLLVDDLHKYEDHRQIVLNCFKQFQAPTMSGCRGKGGKVIGEGRGSGSAGVGEGHEDPIAFPARDIRDQGDQGSGRRLEKPSSQRPRKPYSCATCHDLCCGLARELVTAAFGLGRVTMSRKVMEIVVSI